MVAGSAGQPYHASRRCGTGIADNGLSGMDRSTPLVTVVVPTFNGAPTLRSALASLMGQDCAEFEALVVGDGCTDDSEGVVASFNDARLTWHNLAVNSGSQSAPNNYAASRARGRWIAYLGHDDLWFPWHLSSLLQAAADSGAEFLHSTCLMLHPDGRHQVTGPLGIGRSHADQFTPPVELAASPRRDRPRGCLAFAFGTRVRRSISTTSGAVRSRVAASRTPDDCRCSSFPQGGGATTITRVRIRRPAISSASLPHRSTLSVTCWANSCSGMRAKRMARVPGEPLRAAMQALSRRVADGYGRDRWPMSAILFWRQQRFIRRNRPRRGLPAR